MVRGIVLMVFEGYDFTRNPIVENQTFLLESKCVYCGLAVDAHSLEELLEKEQSHRVQCTSRRAA
jgi:hypothetical protein